MTNKGKALTAILLSAVVSSSATYVLTSTYFNKSAQKMKEPCANECSLNVHRLKGAYKYIAPLQYVERTTESAKYAGLKNQIATYISQKKQSGEIQEASVYLRDFDQADWFSINGDQAFHPGSLIKVPILISYLRLEEKQPGILNYSVHYDKAAVPVQTFNSKQITPGKNYTIRELLEYMIAYSDNNATYLLKQNLPFDRFKRTYERIGLPTASLMDPNYSISAKQYSDFIKILYNVGYLSNEHSEMAMSLLAKCDFQNGFAAGFPKGTPIAHKFGEWGNGIDHELHESGIVYIDGSAYLLTVMTKGKDVNVLPGVIKDISAMIDGSIDNQSTPNNLMAAED
jgi:beta-lactamase class A